MELHLSRRHRVRLVGEGALVGIATGMVISAYRFMLANAEKSMRALTSWLASDWPLVALWFFALAVLCVLVSRLMVFEPYTQSSGIPQIDAEVAGHINMPWKRVLPIKFAEGVACAFAGLSLGREGPSVQLGGMAAKGVSQILGNTRSHERLLVTCGAAAGMSAAFHAPLTGVLFAIEEIHRRFSATLVISVMTSSVVADYVSSQLLGETPVIHLVMYHTLPHEFYLCVIAMGVLCGLLGWIHNKGMFWAQDTLFGPFERFVPEARLAIPFLLAGVVAFAWPDLLCGGDAIIEHVLHAHSEGWGVLLALLLGKYLFTAICFGSGAPGGTLFPLVVMGALVGAICGELTTSWTILSASYVNSFIVLGIAGMFSAVIQAPVTAVVLVFELTGSLDALLATSIVSIVAYVTTTLLKTDAFYEHLLARLLGTTTDAYDDAPHGQKVIHNYVVGAGSTVDGQLVKDITWPKDSLVVTIRHVGTKVVPKGDTKIAALSEISVLMDEAQEVATDKELKALCMPQD